MAFAALGAAELLAFDPETQRGPRVAHRLCRLGTRFQHDRRCRGPSRDSHTRTLFSPRRLIAAGAALDDSTLRQRGLDLLAWLVAFETADGHLSPTPVGGRGAEDARPGFDQQPIEVSTLADACARAAGVDSNPIWLDGVRAAAAWFMGDNDAGQQMWDPETGGGYDGLHADGVNGNQGAESNPGGDLDSSAGSALIDCAAMTFGSGRASSRAARSGSRPASRGSSRSFSCPGRRVSSFRTPARVRCWLASSPSTRTRLRRVFG